MARAATSIKQHAHELIDPVARRVANAPFDDEPVSDEERSEIAAARASFDRAEAIPNEDVLADFGLTSEDFERMGRTPLETNQAR